MTAPQMRKSPLAGGLIAEQSTNRASLTPAAHKRNEVAKVGIASRLADDRFERLQNRAARAGYLLRQVESGGYMALKGCSSFHTDSLDAVHAYLVQRGAA